MRISEYIMRRWAVGLAMAGAATTTQAQTLPASPPVLVPEKHTTTQYDSSKGFQDRNGPFSAMLVVVPQNELQEFTKPNGSERHLDRVSRAEAGAVLAVKLIFTGQKADWNNNANVTYDLQVIAPDGRIYGKSDYKAIVALQGRLGREDGVYDNQAKVVLMQFEPQDRPGAYHIKALLHDNVGGLAIPLEATVELVAKPVVAVTPDAASTASSSEAASSSDSSSAPPAKKHKRRHR